MAGQAVKIAALAPHAQSDPAATAEIAPMI
jgi:hypothetical protein